jgi:hypothetical protein
LNAHPGLAYTSFQNDIGASEVLLAHSVDKVDGSGAVNIFGGGLVVTPSNSEIGPIANPTEFSFNSHATETYNFFSTATNDTINFKTGFGAATVIGFVAANAGADMLNLSSLFATFADAESGMSVEAGTNNLDITDSAKDTITIVGAAHAALTASRLGFTQ